MPITHATIPTPPAQVGETEWAEEHTLPTPAEIGAATSDHEHAGVYEPADATILKDADIGVSVAAQGHTHAGMVTMLSGLITTTSSSDGTNYSAVTDSAVTITNGYTYRIRWMLRTYSAANTTGVVLRRVFASSGAGTVYGWHSRGMSNATAVVSHASREGTNDPFVAAGNATSSTTASGSYMVECLVACTASGTLGLEMRSEVNASSATVDGDGSYWVAEQWAT